jgi:hypothetical protein
VVSAQLQSWQEALRTIRAEVANSLGSITYLGPFRKAPEDLRQHFAQGKLLHRLLRAVLGVAVYGLCLFLHLATGGLGPRPFVHGGGVQIGDAAGKELTSETVECDQALMHRTHRSDSPSTLRTAGFQ